MDAWRVRESVDFLSLASGRRDGPGVFGDPEKAGAKLNVSNLAVIQRAATAVSQLAEIRPSGTILASGLEDVNLWDVATARKVATLEHPREVNSVAFSPDGTILASGSGDNKVRLWEVSTERKIATLNVHTPIGPSLTAVAFSPVSTILASGSGDGKVKLWDVATRRNIDTFEAHSGSVFSVAFSPDGTTLASAGITVDSAGFSRSTVKLWDVSTRQTIATFEAHSGSVHSVAFSPDGTTLASGSRDNTVKLYDVSTRRNIATLGAPNSLTIGGYIGRVQSVAFSPDGAILAAGATVGDVRRWSVLPVRGEVRLWSMSALGLDVPSQDAFSLSLDGDGAAGDQATTSLDVSPGSVVSIQVFGKDIQDAIGVSVRFEYDAAQVLYEGFDPGGVLPDAQVLSVPDTNPTAIEISMVALGGQPTADSGLVGSIRFRTTGTFSGTTLRLVRAELGRGGKQRESVTLLDTSMTLQLAALTSDFNGDAGGPDRRPLYPTQMAPQV